MYIFDPDIKLVDTDCRSIKNVVLKYGKMLRMHHLLTWN